MNCYQGDILTPSIFFETAYEIAMTRETNSLDTMWQAIQGGDSLTNSGDKWDQKCEMEHINEPTANAFNYPKKFKEVLQINNE